jgi:hypothetical protein
MDLLPLEPGQWDHLAGLLVDLTAAAGLALTAAFAFLLGHVVLPAFADGRASVERPDDGRQSGGSTAMRWILYQVAIVSAIAMLVGLGRAILSAVDVLQDVYPRFLI